MIEVQDLTKRYGAALAVDRLSFRAEPGRVTGFLGPNGAGKSTTMRAMVGLHRPDGGQVLLNGRRYGELCEPLRTVGAMLEAKAAHPGRTAYHHLLCVAESNRLPKRRVDEVLVQTGLDGVAGRRVGGFSLGMGQRLGIATALLGEPEILLFDEPVNGLDPDGVRWIRTLVRELAAEGRTVFMSSHLMSEMAQTADHLVIVGRGRLLADTDMDRFIEDNSVSKVKVRVRTSDVEQLMSLLSAKGISCHQGVDGAVLAVGVDATTVGRIASAHGVTIHELAGERGSLEEAFMRLTASAAEFRAGDR
ncbi:ATP-binding cassette domain-containing protein [Streptomyces sp. DSM 40750]|uniref:ATP-binding cassette domain-containing protein n=1 Tax=Streptomyces sp. DSM 40750 TaxID=2801030 RepID=UPI00214AA302|nr:ATP-binding cassette domain-containing protein [Streptomyces sp. DSM 40750]UUU21573.1 ATP-binding cassette domain-containing protein [Streptomyces sp. DSM 40750]